MATKFTQKQIDTIISILRLAHAAILDVYERDDFGIEIKGDQSPVTMADKLSHDIIVKGLENNFDFPVLSEEGQLIDSSRPTYWLVDPLDGTKEFIARNGEFTTNIALIQNGSPCFGIIGVPTKENFYFGHGIGTGVKISEDGTRKQLSVRPFDHKNPICLVSRSHMAQEQQSINLWNSNAELKPAGSALKFCLLAEGSADIYLRRAPCMLWDSAAGQCIVESAGGKVVEFSGSKLRYDLSNLKNPPFICISDDAVDFSALVV